MRAIYHQFTNDLNLKKIDITDESAKHLNVVRVKVSEKILVLNGDSLKAYSTVTSVSKNLIELSVDRMESSLPYHTFSLAIACPKKDAFEDILKICVELGIRNIYPLTSDFSQYEYVPSERIERILESALIQSNNSFIPKIHSQENLRKFIENQKNPIYFFNSKPHSVEKSLNNLTEKMILIGPEGGFSEVEEGLIMESLNTISIHLPTPIQRAPTAVASSLGYLLSRA